MLEADMFVYKILIYKVNSNYIWNINIKTFIPLFTGVNPQSRREKYEYTQKVAKFVLFVILHNMFLTML